MICQRDLIYPTLREKLSGYSKLFYKNKTKDSEGISLMALMLSIIRDLWDAESIGLTRQVQEFLYASIDQHIDCAYKR